MSRALIAYGLAVLVAALAACAAPADDDFCVEREVVPVVVEGQIHLAQGGCRAWEFGPTRQQREDFDRRQGGKP